MGSAATTESTGTQTDGKHHVVANSLIVSSLKTSKKNLSSKK